MNADERRAENVTGRGMAFNPRLSIKKRQTGVENPWHIKA
jgi:hypothetical protein